MNSSLLMSFWVVTLIGVVTLLWIAMLSAVAFATRRLAARR
jgi:hypothetical protein